MAIEARTRRRSISVLDDDPGAVRGRTGTFMERHSWVPTTALATLQALVCVVLVADTAVSDHREQFLVPMLVLSLVLVTAIVLRKRWPVALTILLILFVPLLRWVVSGDLDDPSYVDVPVEDIDPEVRMPSTVGVAGWVLLGTAATMRRPRISWSLLALYIAGTVAGRLLWAVPEDRTAFIALDVTVGVIAVLAGANVRGRRQRVAVLEDRARQLALERDQREQIAVASERNRIAREMHDVVAHSLSVMITLAEGASVMLEKNPDRARRALEELAETGRSSLADARRLVGVLREGGGASDTDPASGTPLAPQPTDRDVAVLVERFRGAGLPVTYRESGPPLPDDAILHLAVYRIVQEALTNVLRHAPTAPRIDVTVERTFERVTIVVDNDAGTGTPTISGSNRGLIGIRERVAAYAGSVDAGPTPTGWRTRALLRLT